VRVVGPSLPQNTTKWQTHPNISHILYCCYIAPYTTHFEDVGFFCFCLLLIKTLTVEKDIWSGVYLVLVEEPRNFKHSYKQWS